MVKSYMDKMQSSAPDNEAALREAEKALKDAEVTKQWEVDTWQLQEQLYGVITRGARLVTPEYQYHSDDEYWDLQEKLRKISFDKQRFEHEKKLEQIDKAIKAREEAIQELKGDGNE